MRGVKHHRQLHPAVKTWGPQNGSPEKKLHTDNTLHATCIHSSRAVCRKLQCVCAAMYVPSDRHGMMAEPNQFGLQPAAQQILL